MPRSPRLTPAGFAYHVYNRGADRLSLFSRPTDYRCFLDCLARAKDRIEGKIRLLGFCIMPNHWHLALYPVENNIIPKFMGHLTSMHAQRWQRDWDCVGSGGVYQRRYHLKPFTETASYLNLLKYIERNPLRAKLCNRAEHWKWSSAAMRFCDSHPYAFLLDEGPVELPADWQDWLKSSQDDAEIEEFKKFSC